MTVGTIETVHEVVRTLIIRHFVLSITYLLVTKIKLDLFLKLTSELAIPEIMRVIHSLAYVIIKTPISGFLIMERPVFRTLIIERSLS